MGYICVSCGEPQDGKPIKVVTEKRLVLEEVLQEEVFQAEEPTKGLAMVSAKVRFEIVKQVNACSACAPVLKKRGPTITEVRDETQGSKCY